MNSVESIEKVLSSDLLNKSLVRLPATGVSSAVLEQLSPPLPRNLSVMHMSILRRWNGIGLDIIRIHGVKPDTRGVSELLSEHGQSFAPTPTSIVFADDPSGFIYAEGGDGEIWSIDTDGGDISMLAKDMDEFFTRILFGRDASVFMGGGWLDELKAAGIV